MTAIIAPRMENADCCRRWLFAGRNGACLKRAFEPPAGPRASSLDTALEQAGTLARSAYRPDRRCGLYRRASRTPSAPAKST